MVNFVGHNIRLDDGSFTKPDAPFSMDSHPWFNSARRILDTVFPGDKSRLRLADLGCLEGGYAVEFARLGCQVVGIERRESNIAACRYVQAKTNLPNLTFVQDDAWNLAQYGPFDVVFCSGLLYHLDRPRKFLELLASVAGKLLVLETHFAEAKSARRDRLPYFLREFLGLFCTAEPSGTEKFGLSPIAENESLRGRWYREFKSNDAFRNRENMKLASWDNHQSFWLQKEYLLQAIHDAGFDVVLEQFDGMGPDIAKAMLQGTYRQDNIGFFVGIKSDKP